VANHVALKLVLDSRAGIRTDDLRLSMKPCDSIYIGALPLSYQPSNSSTLSCLQTFGKKILQISVKCAFEHQPTHLSFPVSAMTHRPIELRVNRHVRHFVNERDVVFPLLHFFIQKNRTEEFAAISDITSRRAFRFADELLESLFGYEKDENVIHRWDLPVPKVALANRPIRSPDVDER